MKTAAAVIIISLLFCTVFLVGCDSRSARDYGVAGENLGALVVRDRSVFEIVKVVVTQDEKEMDLAARGPRTEQHVYAMPPGEYSVAVHYRHSLNLGYGERIAEGALKWTFRIAEHEAVIFTLTGGDLSQFASQGKYRPPSLEAITGPSLLKLAGMLIGGLLAVVVIATAIAVLLDWANRVKKTKEPGHA